MTFHKFAGYAIPILLCIGVVSFIIGRIVARTKH